MENMIAHSANTVHSNKYKLKLKSFRDMSKRWRVSILVRLSCLTFLVLFFTTVWNM